MRTSVVSVYRTVNIVGMETHIERTYSLLQHIHTMMLSLYAAVKYTMMKYSQILLFIFVIKLHLLHYNSRYFKKSRRLQNRYAPLNNTVPLKPFECDDKHEAEANKMNHFI